MKTVHILVISLISAISAFGELPSPLVSFDSSEIGIKTVGDFVSKSDSGNLDGPHYWFAEITEKQTVDSNIGRISRETERGNYLAIDSMAYLWRTINTISEFYGAPDTYWGNVRQDEIEAGDIYLDSMVKFTPASTVSDPKSSSFLDKLSIYYVESEDEPYITNFIVTAGWYYSDMGSVQTNYYLQVPNGFKPDQWHRLTIRAIPSVSENYNHLKGFAIYLDCVLLTYNTNISAGSTEYIKSLNASIIQNLYNEKIHAFIPNSNPGGIYADTLSGVGYEGSGGIDDIVFLKSPPFPMITNTSVRIAWDDRVASLRIDDNLGVALVNLESLSGEGFTNLTVLTSVSNLSVNATYAIGSEKGDWKVYGAGSGITNDIFSIVDGAMLSVKSKTPNVIINGIRYEICEEEDMWLDVTEYVGNGTEYAPVMVKLLADIGYGEVTSRDSKKAYVNLDLAGKRMAEGLYVDRGIVTISNSTDTVGHIGSPEYHENGCAWCANDSCLIINAGIYHGKIVDYSSDGSAIIVINGGIFYDPYYVKDNTREFYLKDKVSQGCSVTGPTDGYFTVYKNP